MTKRKPTTERDGAAFAAFLCTLVILSIVQLAVHPPILLAESFLQGAGWIEILAVAAYAGWLVRGMVDPTRTAALRLKAWLFFSGVFFGQLVLGLAGFHGFLMTGTPHLPVPALILAGPAYRGEGLFMPILFGATVVLAGPAWCSHLCYLGSFDNLAATRRRRPLPFPRSRRPAQLAVLAAVMASAVLLRLLAVGHIQAAALAAAFGVGGVAVMVLASRRTGGMVHCTLWCPIGAVATFAGRINPFRLRIGQTCDDCGACTTFCRYGALRPSDIARRRPGPTCTLCGDCIRSCKKQALYYHFPGLGHAAARTAFLVTVVTLHAVFLALARD